MIKQNTASESTATGAAPNNHSTKPSISNTLFDPNKLSDDEDNSWNEELSLSYIGEAGCNANEDEYYGEEDEYGDESLIKESKNIGKDADNKDQGYSI